MNMKRILAVVGTVITLAFCATTFAADWPQFHGPNRDNISREAKLLKKWPKGGPKLLWTAEGCGLGLSSVAIADGG